MKLKRTPNSSQKNHSATAPKSSVSTNNDTTTFVKMCPDRCPKVQSTGLARITLTIPIAIHPCPESAFATTASRTASRTRRHFPSGPLATSALSTTHTKLT